LLYKHNLFTYVQKTVFRQCYPKRAFLSLSFAGVFAGVEYTKEIDREH